jgi:hypothetical protein
VRIAATVSSRHYEWSTLRWRQLIDLVSMRSRLSSDLSTIE